MRGIDWDKVRRQRNVRKADYLEELRASRRVNETTPARAAEALMSVKAEVKKFTQPLKAGEIRMRLRAIGKKGSLLNKLVNQVMRGEQQLFLLEIIHEWEVLTREGFNIRAGARWGSDALPGAARIAWGRIHARKGVRVQKGRMRESLKTTRPKGAVLIDPS